MKIILHIDDIKMEGGFDLDLPSMIPVRQIFKRPFIAANEIAEILSEQYKLMQISSCIKPGMKIAVGVGSRGIANLCEIVRHTVTELKKLGALPFIVPAMGSHGGASADGQTKVLAEYGITEEAVGAPIRASMDTIYLGQTDSGIDVYFDRIAYEEADGIIVIARIKPHPELKGPIESGILKMLGIGLGKHKGASYLHLGGMKDMPVVMPAVGEFVMEKTPFLFAVGIVENAFHETAHLEVVLKEALPLREKQLLLMSKDLMPRLLFDEIDVLIVEEVGKNISGAGMDSNITGRASSNRKAKYDAPEINKIVVLYLTKETEGHPGAIGYADYITQHTVKQIDLSVLYTNAITSNDVTAARLPLILANDREAIVAAVRTGGQRNLADIRMVYIKNTLELNHILVSENMRSLVEDHPLLELTGDPKEWSFGKDGQLLTSFA